MPTEWTELTELTTGDNASTPRGDQGQIIGVDMSKPTGDFDGSGAAGAFERRSEHRSILGLPTRQALWVAGNFTPRGSGHKGGHNVGGVSVQALACPLWLSRIFEP